VTRETRNLLGKKAVQRKGGIKTQGLVVLQNWVEVGKGREKGNITRQKVHRHPIPGPVNPAITGPDKGPTTVAADQATMIRPLTPSSQNTSAIAPPTTLTGGAPNVPVRKRKKRNASHVGATADPSRDRMNKTKPVSRMGLRPWDSLSGAKIKGPNMKPRR
jgi:hypothetical protein